MSDLVPATPTSGLGSVWLTARTNLVGNDLVRTTVGLAMVGLIFHVGRTVMRFVWNAALVRPNPALDLRSLLLTSN